MKTFLKFFLLVPFLVVGISIVLRGNPKNAGFYLPDSLQEVTLGYRLIDNLVVLPVRINNHIEVNLVLDTGCRNLVLFGKQFQKLFELQPQSKVQFSGLGDGDPVYGKVSLNNLISIDAVIGNKIPVVVVPNQNLFSSYSQIHGVIGYDIFQKFEIELNPIKKTITFRPAVTATLSTQFTMVPLRIVDSRPILDCQVIFDKDNNHLCDLMLDTGSSLGLLLKTTSAEKFDFKKLSLIGKGFNGNVSGINTITQKLVFNNMSIHHINTGIIYSQWHDHASLGMEVLKDYALVLNYVKGYAGFRKV